MKKYFYILFIFISTICASGGLVGGAYEYGTNAKSISLSNAMISSYNRGNNAFSNPSLLGGVKKMSIVFLIFHYHLIDLCTQCLFRCRFQMKKLH